MAKALLLNALHDALSDYVVGLSPEKLKVGVWSGKIVLEELQVRNHHTYETPLVVRCAGFCVQRSKRCSASLGVFDRPSLYQHHVPRVREAKL